MRRFTFRGVQLDYCEAAHSVWFDRGEYAKIFTSGAEEKERPSKQYGLSMGSAVGEATAGVGAGDVLEISVEAVTRVGEFLGDLLGEIHP